MIVVGIVVVIIVVICLACCKVSGDCAKTEEAREKKEKLQ